MDREREAMCLAMSILASKRVIGINRSFLETRRLPCKRANLRPAEREIQPAPSATAMLQVASTMDMAGNFAASRFPINRSPDAPTRPPFSEKSVPGSLGRNACRVTEIFVYPTRYEQETIETAKNPRQCGSS